MKCASCGTENPGGMRFCGVCTAPLGAVLGAVVAGGAASAVHPAGGFDAVGDAGLDRFFSDGERKLVTVLFADISGFTTLAENMDPEPLRDHMNACFGCLVPCIERYGGTVDKFMGDAVMALFGAPVSHDNDAERAVRAALAMRHALDAFTVETGVALSLHIGINTGVVLAGPVGSGERRHYSVMGDAVNVAARLEEQAGSGEILVGADTHRLAGHLFRCAAAGRVRLRGRSQPLAAWRITGEANRPASDAGDGAVRFGLAMRSPLVGRDEERDRFLAAVERTQAGQGGVLFVLGEAGMGKSRLTAEIRRAAPPRVNWLEGRVQSFSTDLSYLPFREIVQAAAAMDVDATDAEQLEKVALLVERYLPEHPWALLSLAALLALPLPADLQARADSLYSETMGRQVVRNLRRLLRRLAEERPLVLLLEDVHWLDQSSLAFVEQLLPLAREVPVLILLVGRPEGDSSTQALRAAARECCGDLVEEIVLAPLDSEHMRLLVHGLVGGEKLPRDLRETVAAKAEGNPLFAEEVIRALVDLGGLVPEATGGLRVTGAAADIALPDTLKGVITARIDRLTEGPKEALRIAAVIGRTFQYGLLAALVSDPRSLTNHLARLEELEFLRVQRSDSDPVYIFKHVLIQNAAYEGLLVRHRREIHQRVAASLEYLHGDGREAVLGLLAYHYTKAEAWVQAQGYLLAAGRQAGRIAADPETLSHFERALDAHLRAHGGTWGDLISDEGIEWFLEWTSVLMEASRLDAVVGPVQRFHENISAALGGGDPRVLAVGTVLGRAYIQHNLPAAAEALMVGVVGAYERAETCDIAALVRALSCLGTAEFHRDRFSEADATLLRALSLTRHHPSLTACPEHSQLCYILGALYLWTGRFAEAREVMVEGLASPGLPRGWVRECLLINLSMTSWVLGDHLLAEQYARACIGPTTNPENRAHATDCLGLVHLARGALPEALDCLTSAVRTLEEWDPSSDGLVDVRSNLAEGLRLAGRLDEAEHEARRAVALLDDLPSFASPAIAPYWALAGVALARGQLSEAEELLARSEAIAVATLRGAHFLQPEILYRTAQLRRLQRRAEEAQGLLDEACRLLNERRGSPHPRAEAMLAEWTGEVQAGAVAL